VSIAYGIAGLATHDAFLSVAHPLTGPPGLWGAVLLFLGAAELTAAHACRRESLRGRSAGAALSAALLIVWFVLFAWSPLASIVLVVMCGCTLYGLIRL
jgi:hypothetical protein